MVNDKSALNEIGTLGFGRFVFYFFNTENQNIKLTFILVIAKLCGRRDFILGGFACDINVPARNYLFRVSN